MSSDTPIKRYDLGYGGMDEDESGLWMRYEDHERELTALRGKLAAAKRDAERYRWLRQWVDHFDDMPRFPEPRTPEEMDAAIDKERA